jgi:hypothetical protein
MPTAAILCPWVLPVGYAHGDLPAAALGKVVFEIEHSHGPPDIEMVGLLKRRLEEAQGPLGMHGFSVQLPVRQWEGSIRLWDELTAQSATGLPFEARYQIAPRHPDLILTLLTRGSPSTLIESTALAVAAWAPQVCVGIDMPVPKILDDFARVSIVQPDNSEFVQVVDAACRQNPLPGPVPSPVPVA